MEENKELAEKFQRIYKKYKRIDLTRLNLVYESIKQKQETIKLPSTISEISKETKLKNGTVRTCIKHLEFANYIKRKKIYTPPFLKVTNKKAEAEFIYGKTNRENRVQEEFDKVVSVMNSSSTIFPKEIFNFMNTMQNKVKRDSKFLFNYNQTVEYLWKNFETKDFFKLEMGSGANRYFIS